MGTPTLEGVSVRRCWLLIITKDLRVWLPPELYLVPRLALREARRWTETLGRRRAPEDPFAASPTRLRAGLLLHAIETDFMEPWRVCPLWVGVRWSERSYPSLKVEVMAADTDEALAWIRTRSRSPLVGRADPDCRLECFFERRKVLTYVAAHRVKHFCGF